MIIDATSTRAMRHAEESSCARCVVPSQRLRFTMIISGWYSTSRLAHHSADIAALAAAQAHEKGIEPCSVARKAAQANETTLSSCTVDASSVDYVVTVSVTAQLRPMLHIPRAPRTITVTSLAGPQK